MIHEYLIKAVMSVVHVSDNPHATASRCSVSNRKILDIATKVESLKKNRTLLWYNLTTKKHIFRWVRNNINLKLVQG